MGSLKQALKSLDAFPHAEEHLLQKTKSGALVSIVGLVLMATLFLHELSYYLPTYTVHQMAVDTKHGETLPIHINMTFPSLSCDVLSVDEIDMSEKHEVDLDTNIWKNHAIRRADMSRRVVETVFPLTDGNRRNKGLWNWILDKLWTGQNIIKSKPEEFNLESFLFPWHILRSLDDDIFVLNQSFGTLWIIDLESGSMREVVKEPSKIMEICGQAISEKCVPLKHVPTDWLQQRAKSIPSRSFEGISYAGLMSSVATYKDHVVMCDIVGQTVVKFSEESGSATSFRFTNFGILGLPYWLTSSLERVYDVDDLLEVDPDHSQCFRLFLGRVDIMLTVDIPQHADLVELPQEGCVWRQARGSAMDASGVENKAESSEKARSPIAGVWRFICAKGCRELSYLSSRIEYFCGTNEVPIRTHRKKHRLF